MDENKDCFMCHHPILKLIFISLLVFFGAFSAFYVVTDWHFKRMFDPVYQMHKMEQMMIRDQHKLDKFMNHQFHHDMAMEKGIQRYFRLEKTPQNYRIIIDLKAFDNNEKNIEVLTNENSLTVNAAGETQKRGHNEILRVSQTFAFDEDVDLSKINKIREGSNYIIVIPIE